MENATFRLIFTQQMGSNKSQPNTGNSGGLNFLSQVWWILHLLSLTSSAWNCLKNSHNLGMVFEPSPVHVPCDVLEFWYCLSFIAYPLSTILSAEHLNLFNGWFPLWYSFLCTSLQTLLSVIVRHFLPNLSCWNSMFCYQKYYLAIPQTASALSFSESIAHPSCVGDIHGKNREW